MSERKHLEMSEGEGSHVSIKYYAAMLVDILGQRQGLAGWSRIPESNQLQNEAFMNALRDSVGVRREIEKQVRKTFDGFRRDFTFPRLQADPRYSVIADSMNNEPIHTQAFGDTIIAFVALMTAQGFHNARGLLALLAASMATLIHSILIKSPTRIVLDIGAATDAFPGELYGQLLVDLDRAEKKVVDWMRILVGPSLKRLLESPSSPRHDHPPYFVVALGQFGESVVADPVDQKPIIDYLGPRTSDYYTTVDRSTLRTKLLKATREMKANPTISADVVKKYDRLQHYLESTQMQDLRGF